MVGKIQKPVKLFKKFRERSKLPETVLTDSQNKTKKRIFLPVKLSIRRKDLKNIKKIEKTYIIKT
jgi:hypothetical protein